MSAATPRESVIEDLLQKRCREIGALCLKFSSPSRRAVPDRIVIGRDSAERPLVVFVEVKRPGQRPRPDQRAMLSTLRDHGAHAVVVSTEEEVDRFISDYFIEPRVAPHQRDPHEEPLPGRLGSLITGL